MTPAQISALRRIHERGSGAWCEGGRAGGATARMCDRLVRDGYLSGPPYAITGKGYGALRSYVNHGIVPRPPNDTAIKAIEGALRGASQRHTIKLSSNDIGILARAVWLETVATPDIQGKRET